MSVTFQNLFQSNNRPRDKFLARLFGIFSEELVRCWARDNQSPYRNLGRPTVKPTGQQRGYTLDFTFESKSDRQVYIAELKCELEYENYRFLTLESPIIDPKNGLGKAWHQFSKVVAGFRDRSIIPATDDESGCKKCRTLTGE